MAVKFSEGTYWNPSEWVSRTLFKEIESLSNTTFTHCESSIKEKLRGQIKRYVWLIDFSNSKPYELQILKELVESSKNVIDIKEDLRKSYLDKISELIDNINDQINKKSNHSNWNYIKGWKIGNKITSAQLEEWAYSENGIFQDQDEDEDLLMYNPDLISPMFKLLGSKWSNRNTDLRKVLANYYIYNQTKGNNENADIEFDKIIRESNTNIEQTELITQLKSS